MAAGQGNLIGEDSVNFPLPDYPSFPLPDYPKHWSTDNSCESEREPALPDVPGEPDPLDEYRAGALEVDKGKGKKRKQPSKPERVSQPAKKTKLGKNTNRCFDKRLHLLVELLLSSGSGRTRSLWDTSHC